MSNPFIRLAQQHLLLAALALPVFAIGYLIWEPGNSLPAAILLSILVLAYGFASLAAAPAAVFEWLQHKGLTRLTARLAFGSAALFAQAIALSAYPAGDSLYLFGVATVVAAVITECAASCAALFSRTEVKSA